jgi:hypothetical protein
MFISLHTLIEI